MITLIKNKPILYFLLVLLLAVFLRFYGINWDGGCCMHPDERAIVMFSLPINFPANFADFFSPSSSLNPHFFNYGNFPLYLLKGVGSILSNVDPLYLSYQKINLVGRAISATADIGTLILIFLLAKKLFNQTIGLLSSFFYSVSVFPIQVSHFYAVDTLLTFFIILTLYQLTRFYENTSIKNALLTGVFFGFSLATKISAVHLVIPALLTITLDFILIFIKQPNKPHIWFPHVPRFLKQLIFNGVIIAISTIVTFVILQPYTIIDFQEFLRQTQQMSQVTYDAFAFPFTLQYVDKIPYLYELKNIFLWGQGPILAAFSFFGLMYISYFLIYSRPGGRQKHKTFNSSKINIKWKQKLILVVFSLTYFFVVGKFAVGFMRYMLPLYPLLCLFGGVFAYSYFIKPVLSLKNRIIKFLVFFLFIILILIWPFSFLSIYTKPNTRIQASDWINANIPKGKTLAVEHWDDSLPLSGQGNYKMEVLPLYDPDNPQKWTNINGQIATTDYIILASNRLYVPLQKLSDCIKLPPGKCYPITAKYYKDLFSGELGFEKVAEFTSFPTIPFTNIEINDQSADESFTVYDHPKIMIFKKQ